MPPLSAQSRCLVARRAVRARRTISVATVAVILVVDKVQARQVVHVHVAKHVLSVVVDLDAVLDHDVDLGDVRDVIQTLLSLLLLKLQGDSLHWPTVDALHHVCGETSDLVAEALAGDHGHLIADALVDVEIKGETLVVALDDLLRSTLDGLIANTALYHAM